MSASAMRYSLTSWDDPEQDPDMEPDFLGEWIRYEDCSALGEEK